jgi:hypothetical protein
MYFSIVIILALIAAGCGLSAPAAAPTMAPVMNYDAPVERAAVAEEAYAPGAPSTSWSGSGSEFSGIERLIIRNASLNLIVSDTATALDEINALAKELGGYIVESNLYQYQEGLQASVTLRVPADRLDDALDRVRALATEVRRENISGQDVTDQYVDLQSRLRYLEATEKRLLEFLEAAEDTEAAMTVYQQLQMIQADIEQVKGRIQYLEQSAAMATISIELTPDKLAQPIQVGGWHPEGTARDAVQALVRVLQFLVDALIVVVLLVLPVLLAIAIPLVGFALLVRAIVRRRRTRRPPAA